MFLSQLLIQPSPSQLSAWTSAALEAAWENADNINMYIHGKEYGTGIAAVQEMASDFPIVFLRDQPLGD